MKAAQLLEELQARQLLRQLAVSDTGFVFDPRTGQSFSLNPTAREALDWMSQGLSLSQTALRLSEHYAVLPEVAESCLESFVQQLGRQLS